MATKQTFIAEYRKELIFRYDWAENDPAKLQRFIDVASGTIGLIPVLDRTWNHDGEASQAAWKAIGMKGKVTLKGLRALPKE